MAQEGEARTHVRGGRRPPASTGVPGTARVGWGGAAAGEKQGRRVNSPYAALFSPPTACRVTSRPQTTHSGHRRMGSGKPQEACQSLQALLKTSTKLSSKVLTAEGREANQLQSPFQKVFSPLESKVLTLSFKIAPVSLSRRCPAFGSVAKCWLSPRTSCSQESHRSARSHCLGTAPQVKNSNGRKKGEFPRGSNPLPVTPSLRAAPVRAAGWPAGSPPIPRGLQARRQLLNWDSPFLRSEQTTQRCSGCPGLPTEAAQGTA